MSAMIRSITFLPH